VLGVTVVNTVPDVQLERVHVQLVPADAGAGFKVALTLAAPKVRHGAPGTAYVVLAREAGAFGPAAFGCTLRFLTREVDPDTGGGVGDAAAEEYPVNDVELTPADFLVRKPVPEFRAAWDAMPAAGEVLDSFGLPHKSVAEAVAAVVDALGLAPCEGTGAVKAGAPKHAAYLAGTFLGGVRVLARIAVSLEGADGCVLKLNVRAEDEGLPEALCALVR